MRAGLETKVPSEKLLCPRTPFLRYDDAFGLPLWIVDKALLVQPVHMFEVVAFPNASTGTLVEHVQPEQSKRHVINLVLVVFHGEMTEVVGVRRTVAKISLLAGCGGLWPYGK